jgi:hypothetical protein
VTKDIRYVHAGDISTQQAHELQWNVGEIDQRYQELAIVGESIVGAWSYHVEYHRGRPRIQSARTDVTRRYQRKGVASKLWLIAIARWSPTQINATISTDEGRDFLASMTARISFQAPDCNLFVHTRSEDEEGWNWRCFYEAQHLLRKVGRMANAAAKQAKTPPQLKAVS